MARRGLRDPIIHVRPIRESSFTQEFGFSQANGGIRVHNGASIPIFLATCVRADIACQSISFLGRTSTVYNGFTRAKRRRCIENCQRSEYL